MKLYCATTNPGKLREFREIVAHYGGGRCEVEPLAGWRDLPPCEENGATFEENAVLKAMHYGPYADGWLLADDSGLEVDALGGAPGVYSARFSGDEATDESNNRLLLERLGDAASRSALFVCVIALADRGRLAGTFRGAVEGRIIGAPRGEHGFGYDPLFYHEPSGCTFGEMPGGTKLLVSHRARALEKMLAWLNNPSVCPPR